MPDTPPMSAEDRAKKALARFLWDYDTSGNDGEWDSTEEFEYGETASFALEALSSEGLVVVAREDQLTPREMGLVYMDVDEFDDYFGGQYGIELQDLERKLRRLASRENPR